MPLLNIMGAGQGCLRTGLFAGLNGGRRISGASQNTTQKTHNAAWSTLLGAAGRLRGYSAGALSNATARLRELP